MRVIRTLRRIPPWVIVSFITTALLLPWVSYGFHYYDVGWALTKSWMIVEHSQAAFWEPSWLSSLVGGLWLKLAGSSLTTARIGYILLSIGTFNLLYLILRTTYRRTPTLLVLIPCILFYSAGFDMMVINYYTFPLAISFGAILLFLLGRKRRASLLFVCSGILFALLVQARMPSALLLLAIPIASYAMDKVAKLNYWKKETALVFAGFVAGSSFIVASLYLLGYLEIAVKGVVDVFVQTSASGGADNIHHPSRLLVDTLVRYAKVIGVGGLALIGVWFFEKFIDHNNLVKRKIAVVSLLVLVAGLTAFFVYKQMGMYPPPVGMAVILFLLAYRGVASRIDEIGRGLYVLAGLSLLLMNLGSSNPQVGSFKFTALLVLAVGILENWNGENKIASGRILLVILCTNLFSLWIYTRMVQSVPIWELNGKFNSKKLQGQLTVQYLAQETNQVTLALKKGGMKPGDTTLFYVDIPMLHYLTETIPALVNPWISNQSVGCPVYSRTLEMIQELRAKRQLPKYVVRAKGVYVPEKTIPKIAFLDSIWGAEGYDTIAKFDRMILLKRP